MLSRFFTWLGNGRGKGKASRLLTVFQPAPPKSAPRESCEHRDECYLCPVDLCKGRLNPPDEPDYRKPRSSSSGMCVYFPSEGGQPLRIRMSLEGANEIYKRRALEEARRDGRDTSVAGGHRPGLVEVEIPDFLKSQ